MREREEICKLQCVETDFHKGGSDGASDGLQGSCSVPAITSSHCNFARTLGYNHALVELVLQGRTFLEQFAKEHMCLVQQVRRLGMSQELGESAVDDVLAGVAAGKNNPIPGPVHPVARRVAASAGAPGALVVDATPSPPSNLPPSNVQTLEPSVMTRVNCVQVAPPAPIAVNVAPALW